jgi:hypothetical protein
MQHRELRLAQHPCQSRQHGGLCGDRWRSVPVTGTGRRVPRGKVTCYTHGHKQDKRGGKLVSRPKGKAAAA